MLGAFWLSVSMCTFACTMYTVDGEHRRILHILHKWLISAFCLETGGTDGLFAQKTMEITEEALSSYKNQGGYDMLGRTRDQIRTTEQVKAAMATCQALKLDALVIIGGIIYYVSLLIFIFFFPQTRRRVLKYKFYLWFTLIQVHNIFLCSLKVSRPIRMLLSLLRHLLSWIVQRRLEKVAGVYFI